MFELKWGQERELLSTYGMTQNMLRNVKERIEEDVWDTVEMLLIELKPLCAVIEMLSANVLKLADIVYHWNCTYVKLDEAVHSSPRHTANGIADTVYQLYEDVMNEKCRHHIEYDINEPDTECASDYKPTAHGGTKSWAMYLAYTVDGRFRQGPELDPSDLRKAEVFLRRHFDDYSDCDDIMQCYDQYMLQRGMFAGNE